MIRATELERETETKNKLPATMHKTRNTFNMMFKDQCLQSLCNHTSTNTYARELWSETAVTPVSPWTNDMRPAMPKPFGFIPHPFLACHLHDRQVNHLRHTSAHEQGQQRDPDQVRAMQHNMRMLSGSQLLKHLGKSNSRADAFALGCPSGSHNLATL